MGWVDHSKGCNNRERAGRNFVVLDLQVADLPMSAIGKDFVEIVGTRCWKEGCSRAVEVVEKQ